MHPIRFKETDVVFKSPKNAPDGVVGDLFTKKYIAQIYNAWVNAVLGQ